MRLSLHSDYALRLLLYLGARPGEAATTEQVSTAYGVSRHHMVRVVQTLAKHGYVTVTPGRSGGVTLARPPERIRLGHVVRDAEPNLDLVECFDAASNTCPITAHCGLKALLKQALAAFLADLDRHTLADLMHPARQAKLSALLVSIQPAAAKPPRKSRTSGSASRAR